MTQFVSFMFQNDYFHLSGLKRFKEYETSTICSFSYWCFGFAVLLSIFSYHK